MGVYTDDRKEVWMSEKSKKGFDIRLIGLFKMGRVHGRVAPMSNAS